MGYKEQGQFGLEEGFKVNPLMAAIKLARYKFPAKMMSKTDSVIDMGCGNGLSSHFYASMTENKVLGVDLYADLDAAAANSDVGNLSFIKADLLSPSQELKQQGPFDTAMCIDVIEHFEREDGEKIIREYAKLLSDRGMMIIGSPSKFSEAYRSEQSKAVHFYEYEPEEMKELCDKYFKRTLLFSMNDEVVHTGFSKLAWFFFIVAFR